MDHPMTKEESYADRRQLFKNIWYTAMNIDDKEPKVNVISKPKVIKTLRLDEVDRCIAGKKKKQRIKNLRTVCNRLLDFCDRQDADDMFYGQITMKEREGPSHEVEERTQRKSKVTKVRKTKRAKNKFSPLRYSMQARASSADKIIKLSNTNNTTSPLNTKIPSLNSSPVNYQEKKRIRGKHNDIVKNHGK